MSIDHQAVVLERLTPFPGNARQGNVDKILASLRANGQYRSLVVREHDGRLTILAGNHTYLGLLRHRDEQPCPPGCRLCEAGQRDHALCGVIRCDDDTALRINLADNRISDDAGYDDAALSALLASLDLFEGSGYDRHDLDSVLTAVDEPVWVEGRTEESSAATALLTPPDEGPQPERANRLHRTVALDAVISLRIGPVAWAGYQMGFKPGIISTKIKDVHDIQRLFPVKSMPVCFMDNEWHDYDHAHHREVVAETRPKYATVRDVMTRQQCAEAGVEFYPLEQILDWAAELSGHADNVIVIPKYDCLDRIPEQYVIGYSVPTSYGGTPMPAEMLRGRRVHLLGGSWRRQRQYLALLGDGVVSFDNNHLMKISRWGHYYLADGRTAVTENLHPDAPRAWQASAILSLAAIRDDLNRTFATRLEPVSTENDADLTGMDRSQDEENGP